MEFMECIHFRRLDITFSLASAERAGTEYHPFQTTTRLVEMDRLDAIKFFVRVVQSGSFSAVAREYNVGQPFISKQIAALEAHLGAELVLRTSRRVTVTDAGRTFYDAAVGLIEDFEAAESLVGRKQASPSGIVRVTAAPALGRLYVVPLLPKFLERYPDVSVELSASERHVDLVAEGFNLAIRHGSMADSTLKARRIASAPYVIVGSRTYFETFGKPSVPADLSGRACIAYAPLKEVRAWEMRGADGTMTKQIPVGRFRTGDAENIRASVLSGLGLAQAPGWLFARELAAGEVKSVLEDYQPAPLAINLVYPARGRPPERVRVLIEFLTEYLPDDKYLDRNSALSVA